ncbi:phage holin family protein [Candidatus Parcubacteria bacterium]|nr:phage holin family protein [Candidatus Parcubacteria bacterium]
MFKGLVLHIAAGILGLWLAVKFVAEVEFIGEIQSLLLAGIILGLANLFLKPILKLITWPLRIITLGLFTIIINLALVWGVDILFPELIIRGILPLFYTTIIVLTLNFLLPKLFPEKTIA